MSLKLLRVRPVKSTSSSLLPFGMSHVKSKHQVLLALGNESFEENPWHLLFCQWDCFTEEGPLLLMQNGSSE